MDIYLIKNLLCFLFCTNIVRSKVFDPGTTKSTKWRKQEKLGPSIPSSNCDVREDTDMSGSSWKGKIS